MEDTTLKEKGTKQYDCSRGCDVERTPMGELKVSYNTRCCKLSSYDWMEGIHQNRYSDLFEVRFKNTRKIFFRNTSGQIIKKGDLVVVEAQNGHDLGIVTLDGPVVLEQLARRRIDPDTYEFRRIYRKAKILDIERWQEAISREQKTMIRSRQLAARLGLDMKIGDVEFQGDGSKAIFYYIADERVDFRQLIKDFAEEFHIRVEMKQIGARQEAGLIGGLGVCGRALCCSNYMSDFQSITTQAARCQDLSLNPQKLAGQCSKLKCCINYEASTYVDAQKQLPDVRGPIELEDGPAWLMKTDILRGILYFSYDQSSLANLHPLTAAQVRDILAENRKGNKPASLQENGPGERQTEFISAVGDDSITRFDEQKKRKGGRKRGGGNRQRRGNNNKHGEREKK
jgi:cell fate regulator YaaT (PSP1 superfamily)